MSKNSQVFKQKQKLPGVRKNPYCSNFWTYPNSWKSAQLTSTASQREEPPSDSANKILNKTRDVDPDWIRIQDFVDPDPYWESGSRGKKLRNFSGINAPSYFFKKFYH
jgi:hypothetical protein